MFDELIGRDHASGVLRAEITRAVSSHGGLVLVAGEAGIGKTALVTGAAEEARGRGALVLGGSCWDAENAPGYWPWVQVLRALRRAAGAEEWADLARAGGSGLAMLLGEREAAGEGEGGQEAGGFELYDAVTTALVSASHRRPVLVVLEDLHWADPATLRLLRFAAQHTWFERLLLIGTYRDAEVEQAGHPLRPLLTPLVAKATPLTLTGLTAAGTGALMTRVTGRTPTPALVREVHRRTGGNPFFVEQTARLWHSGGSVSVIPPGVGDTVRRRLGLLPARVVSLLTDAAVLGREFHRQVLSATARAPAPETDRLLAHAVSAGLVLQQGAGQYSFVHDLVRESLYQALDEGERARRHAAVVRALDSLPALADRVPPADLGRHAHLAGAGIDPERALDLLRAAAENASGRMAFEEAAGHLRHAWELAAAANPRRRVLIGLDFAPALELTGDRGEGIRVFTQAVAEARALDDPGLLARVALSLYRAGGTGWLSGLGSLRTELLRESYQRLRAGGEDEREAVPADVDVLAGRLTLRTVVLARHGSDDEALAFGLWTRHDLIWGPGTAAERAAITRELIALAGRTGERDSEYYARSLLWVALLELGDPGYREELAACTAMVDRADLPRYHLFLAIDQAIVCVLQGRFAEAAGHMEKMAEVSVEHAHQQQWRQFSNHLRWALLQAQGFLEELDALHRAWADDDHPFPELVQGLTAARRGDAAAVLRHFDVARRQEYPAYAKALWLRFQAQAAALSGDAELRERARTALAPYRDQWAVSMFGFDIGGPVALWTAVLDAAAGSWDEAVAGFTAAAASADRLGARAWAVESRARLAAALRERGGPGDAARAAALREEVAAEAAGLGIREVPVWTAPAEPPAPADTFRYDGTVWELSHAGRTVHLPDAKGLRDLHQLLGNPGREIPAARLLDPEGGRPLGGDPVLDDEAKARYRRRLDTLDDEIDRASLVGNEARAAELDRERAALLAQLRAAAGLGGRDRRLGDEAERARKTVTARIRDTLRRLDGHHPELGAHLRATVTTGTLCAYRPAPGERVHFRL